MPAIDTGSRRTAVRAVALCGLLAGLLGNTQLSAAPPEYILRQPDSIQKAWDEIEGLIEENEKLPQPLPEPYLARAELWAAAGSQQDALEDYLRASELILRQQRNPIEIQQFLATLHESLKKAVEQPRPAYPLEALTEYERGRDDYIAGRHALALRRFEDACRFAPTEPLYRAWLALALRSTGARDRAEREAGVAASLLQAEPSEAAAKLVIINRALERVQGPIRIWLNRQLEQPPR